MSRDYWSVPDLLKSLGLSTVEATMATPDVYNTPAGSDVYAQSVQALIAALQNAYGMKPTGQLGAPTAAAISRKSGPQWANKAWLDLLMEARGKTVNNTKSSWLGLEGDLAPPSGKAKPVDQLVTQDDVMTYAAAAWQVASKKNILNAKANYEKAYDMAKSANSSQELSSAIGYLKMGNAAVDAASATIGGTRAKPVAPPASIPTFSLPSTNTLFGLSIPVVAAIGIGAYFLLGRKKGAVL